MAGSHTVIEETTVGGRGRVTPHRYDKDISVYILHTSLLIGTGESRWIVLGGVYFLLSLPKLDLLTIKTTQYHRVTSVH